MLSNDFWIVEEERIKVDCKHISTVSKQKNNTFEKKKEIKSRRKEQGENGFLNLV